MSLASDIARLKQQEETLRFKTFDEKDAWTIGAIMREEAVLNALPIVIDIRIINRPLLFVALAGSTPENPDWVRKKFSTVFRFHKSSYRVGREFAERGLNFYENRGVSPQEFTDNGGSFPIHIVGTGVIGAITVSGLSQRDDHNYVVAAIAKFLNINIAEIALGMEQA